MNAVLEELSRLRRHVRSLELDLIAVKKKQRKHFIGDDLWIGGSISAGYSMEVGGGDAGGLRTAAATKQCKVDKRHLMWMLSRRKWWRGHMGHGYERMKVASFLLPLQKKQKRPQTNPNPVHALNEVVVLR